MNVLLKKVVDTMANLHTNVDIHLFSRIKDKVEKKYKNYLFGAQPYNHAIYAADLCLELKKYSMIDKISAITSITIDDFKHFSVRLLSSFYMEILIHGNCSSSEAETMASTLIDGFRREKIYQSDIPQLRVVNLGNATNYLYRFCGFNPSDPNSVVEIIYQIGATDLENNAALALIKHLMQEPSFDELRTQEQLGYIVHSSVKTNGDNIKSLLFLIQSDSYGPKYLDDRIEAFIGRYRARLASMEKDEFDSHVKALSAEFLEKNKNLAEESSRYWSVICNGSYLFQRYQLLAKEIQKLSHSRVVRFFDKFLAKDGDSRKKLSVHIYGNKFVEESKSTVDGAVDIENAVDFKRCSSLYPLPPPVSVQSMKVENK